MELDKIASDLEADVKLGESCALELRKHNWATDDDAWKELGPSGVAQWFSSQHAIRKGKLATALLKVLEEPELPPKLLRKIKELLSLE